MKRKSSKWREGDKERNEARNISDWKKQGTGRWNQLKDSKWVYFDHVEVFNGGKLLIVALSHARSQNELLKELCIGVLVILPNNPRRFHAVAVNPVVGVPFWEGVVVGILGLGLHLGAVGADSSHEAIKARFMRNKLKKSKNNRLQ